MAKRLVEEGANGLVLFNRFYQPDIDLETLEVVPRLVLSNSAELRLPLRWVAILYGRLMADLAITTGITHVSRCSLRINGGSQSDDDGLRASTERHTKNQRHSTTRYGPG
jgi:dihydroorotate dehydrogenase